MSLTGKQKIYFLLNVIDDKRVTTPSGQPILIHPLGDLKNNYPDLELMMLFQKLQNDEQVLKVTRTPIDDENSWAPKYEDDYIGLELHPAFDEYFTKKQSEPEYQEFSNRRPAQPPSQINNIPKVDRKALEKIWNVLQEIEEKRQLSSDDGSIRLPCYTSHSGPEADEQYENRKTILHKLQSLEAISELHKGVTGAYYYWSFKVGNNYQKVFDEYQNDYKESADKYEQAKQVEVQETKPKDIVYGITYLPTREVLLNQVLQLAKPDFESENEVVFSFLYEHPNETYTQKEIEVELKRTINKSLHKIVENLGFTGDLKRVFFDVSKDSICFKNPITRQDLDKLGITRIKLPK